jgi:uncharacterized membrane protein
VEEPILAFLERAGRVISLVGVAVIVMGFLVATVRGAAYYRRLGPVESFGRYKVRLGGALLLGLEILVVADVIETITVRPSFESLAALGILVVLRTILSWTLSLEVEGRWPWQPAEGS